MSTTDTGTEKNVILEKQWGGHRITIRKPYGKHRRPSYDYRSPLGDREQRSVPKEVGTQFEHLELWAEAFIDEKRKLDEEPKKPVPVGMDQDGLPIWSITSLFNRFIRDKLASYRRHQMRVDFGRAMNLFKHIVGGMTDARRLDQKSIDSFVDKRKAGVYLPLPDGGRREYASADARYDLELLDQVFKYCMRLKLDEETWLLPAHPFERLDLPGRANGNVSIFREVWFTEMLKVADEIDPRGRFRLMLVIARYCGHRQDAIGCLTRASLCLTPDEVSRALDNAAFKFVDVDEAAVTWEHGALHWHVDKQKAARNYRVKDVQQFDRVLPVGPVVREEINHYLRVHWNKRELPLSSPLFPCDMNDGKPLYRDAPQKWFLAAEDLLRTRGVQLPTRMRTRWHGWRRQRRTELKNAKIHDKDVACLLGATVSAHAQKNSINGNYLGFEAQTLFDAACVGQR
jgi:hypothetical protein